MTHCVEINGQDEVIAESASIDCSAEVTRLPRLPHGDNPKNAGGNIEGNHNNINQNVNIMECEFCFCTPCVTTHPLA